ncbi:MAG: DUF2254 domain-containing protein, partial [Dehalococcoidales bacterium]|nr:DUF2254 domain-containing protein [Dehalococcoidales bacterium]
MKSKVFEIWFRFISSLWFIPAIMVISAIILWYVMSLVDATLDEWNISLWWVYSGGLEGARSIFSTIASSIITVAGVVFSITIVVLSQSAGQYGPQLVRSFMQDRSTQIALGTFVATFIYSLLTLGTLRGISGDSPPQAGTTLALLLALASIGVLIQFIHNMARSIQSNRIIARVAKEMNGSINRVFPAGSEHNTADQLKNNETPIPDTFDATARPIFSSQSGFIQAIDLDKLMRVAEKKDLIFKIQFNPGQFVPWKGRLVSAWPAEHVGEKLAESIQKAFTIGDERTTEQDVEFSIERLAMIAVRALSPGINDPYTAIICIKWLGVMLSQLAEHSSLPSYHYDKNAKLRIVTNPVLFSAFADAAFNEIRYSASSPVIFIQLLDVIDLVSNIIKTPQGHDILSKHARDIDYESRQKLT